MASRREFLSGALTLGAALGAPDPAVAADTGAAQAAMPAAAKAGAIPAHDLNAEREAPGVATPGVATPGADKQMIVVRPGADFMVDVLKTLDIEYVAANPGSTFRGLQESIVNYGRNESPEWLTCCHEESSVAIAHGYFKIAGKPMAAMVHSTVGVMHASMAIYNAYADRIPILIISGNAIDANTRRVPAEWYHSVQDNAAMVRDYTKWDDTPTSLQHFAESMVRAARLANALPGAPVMITADMGLQENEISKAQGAALQIPRLSRDTPPVGDDGALREAARLLAAAERPVIMADRYARTARAMPLLEELAELVAAPVLDTGNRVNFPNTHPLNQSGRRDLVREADFILALEPEDLWGATHEIRDSIGKPWSAITAPGVKIVSIGTGDLLIKANYQDFQRYSSADLAITGDPEATLPRFIELLREQVASRHKGALAARRRRFEDDRKTALAQSRAEAAVGWDLSPVHPARIAMELWDLIKGEDWSLVGNQTTPPAFWAKRLWPMITPYCHTGGNGAAGIGYGLPSAVGSALANRAHGRLSINFQNDGDFMYAPGALWTAAHHRVPLLSIMYNNRGYHQELMHLQVMAGRHDRGVENAGIGTALRDPDFNYAKMAEGMGVYAEGPIVDPGALRAAFERALAVVKQGRPALVDVVTQPR
jgi:acetolactate synthase-1/2/3 large subunit